MSLREGAALAVLLFLAAASPTALPDQDELAITKAVADSAAALSLAALICCCMRSCDCCCFSSVSSTCLASSCLNISFNEGEGVTAGRAAAGASQALLSTGALGLNEELLLRPSSDFNWKLLPLLGACGCCDLNLYSSSCISAKEGLLTVLPPHTGPVGTGTATFCVCEDRKQYWGRMRIEESYVITDDTIYNTSLNQELTNEEGPREEKGW